MKAVIIWTLRSRKWSIIFWALGVVTFLALELSFYPTIKNSAQELNQALSKLPSAVQSLFGSTDLFSPIGYLNSRVYYLLLPLLLSLLAIGMGSSLLAKEESSNTIELLLSRPISRSRLLLAKLLAGIIIISIVSMVGLAAILIISHLVKLNVSSINLIYAGLMAYLLALLFGSIAFAVSSLGFMGRGSSIAVATIISFGGYIIASLESYASWLGNLSKIFPYHYYNSQSVLIGERPLKTAAGFILATVVFGLISWLAFRRRDLTS